MVLAVLKALEVQHLPRHQLVLAGHSLPRGPEDPQVRLVRLVPEVLRVLEVLEDHRTQTHQ